MSQKEKPQMQIKVMRMSKLSQSYCDNTFKNLLRGKSKDDNVIMIIILYILYLFRIFTKKIN